MQPWKRQQGLNGLKKFYVILHIFSAPYSFKTNWITPSINYDYIWNGKLIKVAHSVVRVGTPSFILKQYRLYLEFEDDTES